MSSISRQSESGLHDISTATASGSIKALTSPRFAFVIVLGKYATAGSDTDQIYDAIDNNVDKETATDRQNSKWHGASREDLRNQAIRDRICEWHEYQSHEGRYSVTNVVPVDHNDLPHHHASNLLIN